MIYTREELESFVKGLKKAATVIRSRSPDIVLAPMRGSIPFIDIIALVDRKFDYSSVYYPPTSSCFDNVNDVTQAWFMNMLGEQQLEEKLAIVALEEVVSGSSVIRGYNNFLTSLKRIAEGHYESFADQRRMLSSLKRNLDYHVVGIAQHAPRAKAYDDLKRDKKVTEIPVDSIITMDELALNPARYEQANTGQDGRLLFNPRVVSFDVTEEYMGLLKDTARLVGADPSKVQPVNMARIMHTCHYLE